jgi:prolyl-tRNA synthetase
MGIKRVPVRIAVGPKDLENGTFEVAQDTLTKVKSKDGIATYISDLLEIQTDLFNKALNYRDSHIYW